MDLSDYYPEGRMKNMFKVISRTLGAQVERCFKETDVWEESFSDARNYLNECMRILDEWKKAMRVLVNRWKADPRHKWQGDIYQDSYLEAMLRRITEIFELRSQHDELLRLMT